MAIQNNLKSIVIPPISTGVYRFPVEKAAQVSIQAVRDLLADSEHKMDVYFAMKENEKYDVYNYSSERLGLGNE